MNVLLLTPDAVGGTLLHTTLTVLMQLHRFDRPVISLYDLVLGVETYYSPEFAREIVRTQEQYQTLEEIKKIVDSVDHYKVAKLTQYNIKRRQDSVGNQVNFYRWLNDNFFIIACRRDNVFEHSLSWALNKITNRLNVYSFEEKIQTFAAIYADGVSIDPLSLIRSLEDYRSFIDWCDTHFSVASYYSYEQNLPRLEEYILDLPIFAGQKEQHTWKKTFGIDFNSWNQHHFLCNDIGGLILENQSAKQMLSLELTESTPNDNANALDHALLNFLSDYQKIAAINWPQISSIDDYYRLPDQIRNECENIHKITYWLDTANILSNQQHGNYGTVNSQLANNTTVLDNLKQQVYDRRINLLIDTQESYQLANKTIEQMRSLGIIGKTIPVKKQTLTEKAAMIRNFDQCVDVYNQWIQKNPHLGSSIDSNKIHKDALKEVQFWNDKQQRLK